jgi:glutamyl-tRNA synthetase
LRTAGAPPVTVRTPGGKELTLDPHRLIPEPVLLQREGTPAYQVASLSDDIDFGVDLIVRGEDLLPSTAAQLHMARVLGLNAFLQARFVHHPLLSDATGNKLSKSRPQQANAHLEPDQQQLHAWRTWAEAQADLILRDAALRR